MTLLLVIVLMAAVSFPFYYGAAGNRAEVRRLRGEAERRDAK